MKKRFPRCSSFNQLLPVLAFLASNLSHGEIPQMDEIEWSLADLQDENDAWWKSFVIYSVAGVGYEIETSTTLENWEPVESYYGSGGPIHHALFPTAEPAPATPEPPSRPPLPSVASQAIFCFLEKSSSGHIILNWRSLDSGNPVRHLTGHLLDPAWDEFEGPHMYHHGGYMMILMGNLVGVSPDPDPAPLSIPDQAVANAFSSALPSIVANLEVLAEGALSNPPKFPIQTRSDSSASARTGSWTRTRMGGRTGWNSPSMETTPSARIPMETEFRMDRISICRSLSLLPASSSVLRLLPSSTAMSPAAGSKR